MRTPAGDRVSTRRTRTGPHVELQNHQAVPAGDGPRPTPRQQRPQPQGEASVVNESGVHLVDETEGAVGGHVQATPNVSYNNLGYQTTNQDQPIGFGQMPPVSGAFQPLNTPGAGRAVIPPDFQNLQIQTPQGAVGGQPQASIAGQHGPVQRTPQGQAEGWSQASNQGQGVPVVPQPTGYNNQIGGQPQGPTSGYQQGMPVVPQPMGYNNQGGGQP